LEKLGARSVTLFLVACFSGSCHAGALINSAYHAKAPSWW